MAIDKSTITEEQRFDQPEQHDDFEMEGLLPMQASAFRRMREGLTCIRTLAKIQSGYFCEDMADGCPELRFGGQLHLAMTIATLSDYISDDVSNLAHDYASQTKATIKNNTTTTAR